MAEKKSKRKTRRADFLRADGRWRPDQLNTDSVNHSYLQTLGTGKRYKDLAPEMRPLNERHQAVLETFLQNNFNKEGAMVANGYSPQNKASVRRLFEKPNFKRALAIRLSKIREKHDINEERIMQEYAHMAFSSVGDFMVIDGKGQASLDFSLLTNSQRAAITEIKHNVKMVKGSKEGVFKIETTTVKMGDKKGALDALARCFGMFEDNVNVNITGDLVDALMAGRKRSSAPSRIGPGGNPPGVIEADYEEVANEGD